ncbi:MAG: hypothetical protein RL196_761 [Actinomycetota bacterium]|jgi:hypothetical protein
MPVLAKKKGEEPKPFALFEQFELLSSNNQKVDNCA